jgi:hypothetical protein
MSWTDDEIDKLYQTGAAGSQFEYKAEYWREMEAMLPNQKKRGDALWFFFSALIFGLLLTSVFIQEPLSLNGDETLLADTRTFEDVTTQQSTIASETIDAEKPNGLENESTSTAVPHDEDDLKSMAQREISNPIHPTTRSDESSESVKPIDQQKAELNRSDNGELKSIDVGALETRSLELTSIATLQEQSHPWDNAKINAVALNGMFVQLLGGVSQSMVDPSTGWSNSYGAGIGYNLEKGRFILNVGLNWLISNHNDLELTRSAKVYGFGSEVYTYNIDYQQLYLLEGNIELGYLLGRHELKAGVRPSYVFSSRVRVSETATADQSFTSEEHGSYYGYMDGLKRIGLKPTLGYAYRIRPDLQVGMNIGVQLLQGVNEDFVEGKNNNLPIDGQLYLRKTIRFRK